MGRIAAPFGVRGWVRVIPWSDDPATLLSHRVWSIRADDDAAWREIEVLEAKAQGRGLVARVRGVETREAAAALRGCQVGLPRESLAPAKAGEFFWIDLVGLDVVNRAGVALGSVDDVSGNGAHPVLHVRSGETSRLIPFVPAYVDGVDVERRRIDVDWEPDY